MDSVTDFFENYRIQQFYDWQKENSSHPILPFQKDKHKKLSFGIIPGYRNYDLFYERYFSAVKIFEEQNIIQNNMKVLDIGSGEAFFKFFFDAISNKTIQWTGIEVWKERAEFCRHVGYSINEQNLEEGKLPYNDGTFDLVLASHVIEHLPNPKQIIQEMGRVLKDGGMLLIATPTKPPVIAELDSLYHRISSKNTGDTQQAFTHKSLERLILNSLGKNKDSIIDKRGFRILSGRKKLPFENWKWFYNLSKYLGRKLLFLVPEVNIIIRK